LAAAYKKGNKPNPNPNSNRNVPQTN